MKVIPTLAGGLGNRLFQFAAAAGLAEFWDGSVAFHMDRVFMNSHGAPAAILSLFPEIPVLEDPLEDDSAHILKHTHEEIFQRIALPTKVGTTNIILEGYFQSHDYFPSRGIQANWQNALGTARMARIEAGAGLSEETERRRTWFIHFRYGDYKGIEMHSVDLREYYRRCLKELPRGVRLHCFSDEPEECKAFIEAETAGHGIEITWSKEKVDVATLYEMSLCWGGAIIANSTFSWWGAYFAHRAAESCGVDGPVFYPENWGKGMPLPISLGPPWASKIEVA